MTKTSENILTFGGVGLGLILVVKLVGSMSASSGNNNSGNNSIPSWLVGLLGTSKGTSTGQGSWVQGGSSGASTESHYVDAAATVLSAFLENQTWL